ncbi:hypothetical protein [Corynebacterium provencense]|uniref:hypothetical protein n=1 Tax=Corynebacterium provencense TaxID=1737425 RepID=UPI00082EB9E4|nr:hypothetical protein [Corynebacterium provencense]
MKSLLSKGNDLANDGNAIRVQTLDRISDLNRAVARGNDIRSNQAASQRTIADASKRSAGAHCARWRDGAGRDYYYGWRPRARRYVNAYGGVSGLWQGLVNQQIRKNVENLSSWKWDAWPDDCFVTVVFLARPAGPDVPSVTVKIPESLPRRKNFTQSWIFKLVPRAVGASPEVKAQARNSG